VTHVSKATKESRSGISLKYTLVVCYKDNNSIFIKVDTGVNNQIGLVKKGTVLRLVQFESLYYGYEASGEGIKFQHTQKIAALCSGRRRTQSRMLIPADLSLLAAVHDVPFRCVWHLVQTSGRSRLHTLDSAASNLIFLGSSGCMTYPHLAALAYSPETRPRRQCRQFFSPDRRGGLSSSEVESGCVSSSTAVSDFVPSSEREDSGLTLTPGGSCSSSCNGRLRLPTLTFLQKYLDCSLDNLMGRVEKVILVQARERVVNTACQMRYLLMGGP
jgi:hypothetical protein